MGYQESKKRVEWIDIAKGIGIILVIIGHAVTWNNCTYPIYAFHMPLFFFLSGIVYNYKEEKYIIFARNSARKLLYPFFVILTISALVCLVIPQWRQEITLNGIVVDAYYSSPRTFKNTSIWYLVNYFFVLQFFWLIKKLLFPCKYFVVAFIAIALALLWLPDLLRLSSFPFGRLPLRMDTAMVATVFFMAAYMYKDMFVKIIESPVKRIYVVVIILI